MHLMLSLPADAYPAASSFHPEHSTGLIRSRVQLHNAWMLIPMFPSKTYEDSRMGNKTALISPGVSPRLPG